LKRDSWTIDEFCWLLSSADPTYEPWGFIDGRSARAVNNHPKFKAILESCVHTRLRPLNPNDSAAKHRYTVRDLLQAARDKQLGDWVVLAEVLGTSSNAKPTTATLASAGTAARERQPLRRRKALLDVAMELVNAGKGTRHPDRIALSVHGAELMALLKERHPEWSDISAKTLEADRRACKPRIEIRTGRPAKTE
jgi:hypothetical protein